MSLTDTSSDNRNLAVLSAKAREKIKNVLYPDECVLWAGKPVPSAAWCDVMPGTIKRRRTCVVLYAIAAAGALYILVPLVLALLGGTLQLLMGNVNWGLVISLLIISPIILMILFSLIFVVFFPLLSIWQAKYDSYVLTNRQAIIISEFTKDVTLKCVDLADTEVPSVTRKRKDGLGNIIFEGFVTLSNTGGGGMDIVTSHDHGFTACRQAEDVAALFDKAREKRISEREHEDIKEMQSDYQGWLRKKGRL